jgi:ketosteroid isomerase-like protein
MLSRCRFSPPPLKDRNAIQQFYKEQFQSPAHVIAFTFVPFETSVHGDVAYDVGAYSRSTKTPPGTTEGSGSYLVLLKRSGV